MKKNFILITLVFICLGCGKNGGFEKGGENNMTTISSMYRSSEVDWYDFLMCWKSKIGSERTSPLFKKERIEEEIRKNSIIISDIEKKLNLQFPKSYRHFISITGGRWAALNDGNGWLDSVNDSNFLLVGDIGKFKAIDKENFGYWKDAVQDDAADVSDAVYFRYGFPSEGMKRQDHALFRGKYLEDLVKIGELEQGTIIALNPRIIFSDGEMEAWVLSFKLGAIRYRSFAELMQEMAYRDINKVGGSHFDSGKINSTCSKLILTAAN